MTPPRAILITASSQEPHLKMSLKIGCAPFVALPKRTSHPKTNRYFFLNRGPQCGPFFTPKNSQVAEWNTAILRNKNRPICGIADTLLKDKLEATGAVLIQGPKWCGKTTTALQFANSCIFLQDPQVGRQALLAADINPSLLLEGDNPRLIDEWQLAPQLWDAVRHEVDMRNMFGQFILTGSTTPLDNMAHRHSGTGRISKLENPGLAPT